MAAPEPRHTRLAIGAILRNEAPYLLEWIAWHRVIGIEQFFLADNDSDDGTTALLGALQRAGVVTTFRFPTPRRGGAQIPAYREILRRYGGQADWIGFIDGDEFILPAGDARSIRPLVERLAADAAVGAIALNWAIYGSSGAETAGAGLVVERFTQRAAQDFEVNHHFKTLLRPRAARRPRGNPHIFPLRTGSRYVGADGAPLTDHPVHGRGLSAAIIWDGARLNHYVVKSRAEFGKKRSRGRATGATARTDEYFLHHDRNDIIDPAPDGLIDATRAEMARIEALMAALPPGSAPSLWARLRAAWRR